MKRPRRTKFSDYTLEDIKARVTINENGCWETSGPLAMGRINGDNVRLSRISLALTNPDFDIENKKIYACHKCDNDYCVNPEHLFPGTSSDNQKDLYEKVRQGLTFRGRAGMGWEKRPRYLPVK